MILVRIEIIPFSSEGAAMDCWWALHLAGQIHVLMIENW